MKVLYIDHSYHKKTLSTLFVPQMLEKNNFSVDYAWDESWNGGPQVVLDDYLGSYDCYVIFQWLPKISCPFCQLSENITFIPMLDTYYLNNRLSLLKDTIRSFSRMKILNYSKWMHAATIGNGIASKYVQFFNDPSKFPCQITKENRAFFWERMPTMVNKKTVLTLLRKTEIKELHIHKAADPYSGINDEVNENDLPFPITNSEWFENQQSYLDCLADKNIFFQPRVAEGIGRAFLEAMAMGKCVVSPDNGTMNEYIINGINGFLYDPADPQPIDFSDIHRICENARKTVEVGYEKWKSEENSIIDFITMSPEETYRRLYGCDVNFAELAGQLVAMPNEPGTQNEKELSPIIEKTVQNESDNIEPGEKQMIRLSLSCKRLLKKIIKFVLPYRFVQFYRRYKKSIDN